MTRTAHQTAQQTAVLFIITLLMGLCCRYQAFAEVAQEVFFQAKVTDSEGAALTGTHTVIFRLYDTETGGSALWSETQSVIPTSEGVMSCYLGSSTAFGSGMDFNELYYLSVEIDGDGEMSPRIKV
ncbi:MAG: hypothetical protein MJA29_07770, partial [Candidatus Omnitrophica bacterium]|nr:hypothetical protein [Candidatus Omnitrophota bacterium]